MDVDNGGALLLESLMGGLIHVHGSGRRQASLTEWASLA